MTERLAYFIATAAYVGRIPIAPGTFGSVAGLVLYGLIVRTGGGSAIELLAILVTFVLGIWSAQVTERVLGGKDPGPVVIDEVLGMLVTMALLDVNPLGAFVAFLVFRLLDVIKPFPAGRFEHLPGGFGVMMDDAMAGVYGNLLMRGLIAFYPGWFN